MPGVEYKDLPVDANGQATQQHTAANHVRGFPGGAEVTLCGILIVYADWKGEAPGATRCAACEAMDH